MCSTQWWDANREPICTITQCHKVLRSWVQFLTETHAQTAVCPVNAAMLTIKMECNCYRMQQTSAWALNNELTPHAANRSAGRSLMAWTTETSQSTLWIVAPRDGNAVSQGDWSAPHRRIWWSFWRNQQRDRTLGSVLADEANVMPSHMSTWPRLWWVLVSVCWLNKGAVAGAI